MSSDRKGIFHSWAHIIQSFQFWKESRNTLWPPAHSRVLVLRLCVLLVCFLLLVVVVFLLVSSGLFLFLVLWQVQLHFFLIWFMFTEPFHEPTRILVMDATFFKSRVSRLYNYNYISEFLSVSCWMLDLDLKALGEKRKQNNSHKTNQPTTTNPCKLYLCYITFCCNAVQVLHRWWRLS